MGYPSISFRVICLESNHDIIMHIDMDYFFAACEEMRHPELKGKPLAVGTSRFEDREKGVVQTCNYEARKFGVKSGMPTSMAFKLCKELGYLQSDESYYEDVSGRIMEYLKSLGYKMEIMSIDEAALDLGKMSYEVAIGVAKGIKDAVRKKFGLPSTIGLSTGKNLAKMACDKAKPDGLIMVKADEIKDFLRDMAVEKIPGVGPKTKEKLNRMKLTTIGDISKSNKMDMIAELGSFGSQLYNLSNGVDTNKIIDTNVILSISRERTMDASTLDINEIEPMIKKLVAEVMSDVSKKGYLFKTIGVKVRYEDFTEKIKSRNLHHYTDSEEILYSNSRNLISSLLYGKKARKIGVRVSDFNDIKKQKKLF